MLGASLKSELVSIIIIPFTSQLLLNGCTMNGGEKISGGSISFFEDVLLTKPHNTGIPFSLVAVDNNMPVGVARLTRHDMDTKKEYSPWLASVFVKKQFRGNGIIVVCRAR